MEYGTVVDQHSNTNIRAASRDEWLTSVRAGESGTFDLDGRTVFVAGGPETEDDDVQINLDVRDQGARLDAYNKIEQEWREADRATDKLVDEALAAEDAGDVQRAQMLGGLAGEGYKSARIAARLKLAALGYRVDREPDGSHCIIDILVH
jgi:hypothetical protein